MAATQSREPRTQSTVWYLSLPLFEKHNKKLPSRKSFTSKIKGVCEKLGTTRESWGIFAKARSNMYFDGKWTSVTYDAVKGLADNGTDVIFIEKEAVAQVLCKYADDYGIALVETEGFLTDYGKNLIVAAEESGANVVILTDYDASGIKLAHDAGDIPRLGVDKKMLDYFGLDRESPQISVPMRAKKDVMSPIRDLVSEDEYNFLKHKKVEIDAVLAVVGSERFWEYLIHKLDQFCPTRDYTRVISSKPAASPYYPDIVSKLQSFLGIYIDLILEDESEIIKGELKEFEGFISDINERKRKINDRYQAIIDNDKALKELDEKLSTEIKPILKKLADLREEKANDKLQRKNMKEKKDEV